MRFLHVLVTAYCLSGTMANGHRVHDGAIAVDPGLIRMGLVIDVPYYGRGRAEDTGSAVKGHHIDVWMRSCARAIRWGTRRLTIRVHG